MYEFFSASDIPVHFICSEFITWTQSFMKCKYWQYDSMYYRSNLNFNLDLITEQNAQHQMILTSQVQLQRIW